MICDVEARHSLWTGIRSFVGAGGTVLLTTHYLEEAEDLASRVVVIHHGSIIADGSVSEITASVGLSRVRLRAKNLPYLAGAERIEENNGTNVIYTADPEGSALGEPRDALGVAFREQLEHFSRISMPTGIGFRVKDVTVDGHVEHTFGTGGEGQTLDDVLIVVEKIRGRAHGAVEIVSGDAVLDVDHMHRGASRRRRPA